MIVVIDGNIGSGKSTQVQMLGGIPDFSIHREPLDAWGNLLTWFYADPHRWALTFQFKVIHCFNQVRDRPDGVVVVERYPESSRQVFWKALCADGVITDEEKTVYDENYRTFTPDIVIHIRVPPERCYERFQNRGQPGDDQVSIEYLNQLHDLYEDMYTGTQHHVIDGDRDPRVIHEHIKDIISSVQ